MARSKREIPHYYLAQTVNLEAALRWLESVNASRSVSDRFLYGVLLLKAVALALRDHKELNDFWRDGAFAPSKTIHIGVAIALRGGGLVAPALKEADRKDLHTLMSEFRGLVQRARTGGLRSSEMSVATITVTSLGEQGVEDVFPVIYPPQVAIVGSGSTTEQPFCVDGEVIPVRVIRATMAGDHRVSNGHGGALFLRSVQQLLQEPEKL
jgi:pyruvate dehydrogenase E2 component (dihydrolipoamide acetyltransferase)